MSMSSCLAMICSLHPLVMKICSLLYQVCFGQGIHKVPFTGDWVLECVLHHTQYSLLQGLEARAPHYHLALVGQLATCNIQPMLQPKGLGGNRLCFQLTLGRQSVSCSIQLCNLCNWASCRLLFSAWCNKWSTFFSFLSTTGESPIAIIQCCRIKFKSFHFLYN